MFKVSQGNIDQIAAIVEQFGVCYVHGDGNMFITEGKSDFRKDFSNPDQSEATYRVKYAKGEKLPTTVEELHDDLLSSKQLETLESRKMKESTLVTTVTVKKAEPIVAADNTGELQQLLADKDSQLEELSTKASEALAASETNAAALAEKEQLLADKDSQLEELKRQLAEAQAKKKS